MIYVLAGPENPEIFLTELLMAIPFSFRPTRSEGECMENKPESSKLNTCWSWKE